MATGVFVIWERGLRGPQIATLSMRGSPPVLSDRETKQRLFGPVELNPKEIGMPLKELAQVYPEPIEQES